MRANKPNNQNKSLIRQALYFEFHLPMRLIHKITGGAYRTVSNCVNPPKKQSIWPWASRSKAQQQDGILAAREVLKANDLEGFDRQRYNLQYKNYFVVQALKFHFNLSSYSIARILNTHRRNIHNAIYNQKEWATLEQSERDYAIKIAREKYQEYYLKIRDNI